MSEAIDCKAWWSARRGQYNVTLIIAALISAGLLLMIWWLFEARLPCLDITGVSVVIGAILFLPGLGLANVFYLLGPLSERTIRPHDAPTFRRRVYGIGIAFSLLLIFSPSVINLVSAFSGLSCIDKFGQTHSLP